MKQLYIRLIVCFIALFTGSISIYAQQYKWATGGGSTTSDNEGDSYGEYTQSMCTDPNGNVYALSIVHYYTVYADTFTASTYQYDNILVTSYNCQGQMRWAKVITTNSPVDDCHAFGIAEDSLGHIYVAGIMPDDDLKIGNDTTIATTPYIILSIIQLDTSGHFNWIRQVGNNTYVSSFATFSNYGAISVDNTNDVHLICNLSPGAILPTGDTSKSGVYDLDYNPTGTLLSVKKISLDSTLIIYKAVIEKSNNKLYAYGYRSPLFYDSTAHNFIAAFDTARNNIWIDSLYPGAGEIVQGIANDGNGHLYICGGTNGYLIYRGDTMRYRTGAIGGHIAFVIKLDTAGNKIWFSQCNSNYNLGYTGIAITPNNKIGIAGGFEGNMDAKMITGVIDTFGGYLTASFLSVLDTAGNILDVKNLGGDDTYLNFAYSITSDNIGNLYVGGAVADSIPTTLIPAYHTVGGNTDFFVLKYGVDCDCTSMPVCNYTVSGTSTVNTTYTGTTTPSIDSVVWSFGDSVGGISTVGAIATGLTATHVYTITGAANLCATVYTGCGSDINCHTILVNCPASFTASFTELGTTVKAFTYTGTTTALDSVTWNYGDGHNDTGLSALHIYSTSGTYTVCATAYSPCGINTACHTFTVDCTPVSSYTHSGSEPVTFTYTGSTVPTIDSVVWSFGDGHTATGTTIAHTYTVSGTYSVCATAYGICGINTHCSEVVVNCAPTASFTQTGTATKDFTFTGTTAGLDSVIWNFGDGHAASGVTTAHTYSSSATYTVCATVYTACGDNTSCNTIVVDCTPAAAFTDTGTIVKGFTYTGTTPELDSITWDFGDGATAVGSTATHEYSASGDYTVCVTAYGVCGSNTTCSTITVDCTPISNFTYTGISTITFTFTGTTIGLDSVFWILGDGSTATGITVTHAYTYTGLFTPCAQVFTNCGNSSHCENVAVNCLANASFSYTGSDPISYTYTGSTDGLDSVVWYFGDGSTDTGLSTSHYYSDSNSYNVCVVEYSDCGVDSGCNSVVVSTDGVPLLENANIQVFPNPTADLLNIIGVNGNTNYRILALTGICMQSGVLQSGTNVVAINKIASGIYILEMTSVGGERKIVRIVKE